MQITNNIHLEKSGQYFKLVEKGMTNPKNGGEPKEVDINVREFGTIYQALQCIVESDYDLEQDIFEQIAGILECIEVAKEQIKKEFRVEVRSCKG